jgi:hypothetical protein
MMHLHHILIDIAIVFLAILIFNQDIHVYVYGVYQPSYNISTPLYSGNRTAILVSGQLRAGNLSWDQVKYSRDRLMFGGDDPDTPIQTVLEWLIVPYALYGGVDMFIYIQVDRNHVNSTGKRWKCDNRVDPHGDYVFAV